MLLAPALWNGYPLLQSDTGGYLARWYEGYLVPSRSTVFGLYLHFGEDSLFLAQSRDPGAGDDVDPALDAAGVRHGQPRRLIALAVALTLTTALPWLASMLLTDIFAGLSVLSLFLLVLHGDKISDHRKMLRCSSLPRLRGNPQRDDGGAAWDCAAWAGSCAPFCAGELPLAGLVQGSLTIVAGAAMLLSANFALSGQLAWTPGGYGVAFGRMLQDGIVARYLRDHCPDQHFKLCPYRDELPATADDFLWGRRQCSTQLGRFPGHGR